jgi:hypothetical protein
MSTMAHAFFVNPLSKRVTFYYGGERMKKSLFAVFVCCLMFLLTACGNAATSTGTGSSTGTTQNSSETAVASTQNFEAKGTIFEDLNENQVFDPDEIGLSGIDIIYSGGAVTSDDAGAYTIEATEAVTIQVDTSTLPAGYVLTTQNETQTTSGEGNFEPIGYAPSSDAAALSIDAILSENHDDIENYAFDLYMNTNNMVAGNLSYAANATNFVAEDDNMITYYLGDSGKMGVYTKASNQLMVSPAMETVEMVTPFTVVDQLDPSTFDAMYYKGTDTFDGKTVYVFKNEMPGYSTELYVWDAYGLVVHMSTEAGGSSAVMEFRNLIVNEVDPSVFEFPAGAEIIDLTSFGG